MSVIKFKTVADMAELVDAPDLGSGGRPWGFESLYPHQTKQAERFVFLFAEKPEGVCEQREQGARTKR